MRRLILAAVCLSLAGPALAQFNSNQAGTSSGQFLLFGPGARALAMGEAYTAVANDATAVFWNPAGLSLVPRASLELMHETYVADITFDNISYAQRLDRVSVIGASAQSLDIGSIPELGPAQEDLGTFHPRDQLYTLSYARDLDLVSWGQEQFSFGVSLKYLDSQIVDYAHTFTFDVGVMGRGPGIGDRPLQVGFIGQNLAGGLKYDVRTENLPMTYKAGAALEVVPGILVSADAVFPRFGAIYGAAGVEAELRAGPYLAIDGRAGLNTQGLNNLSGFGGTSFGGGIKLAFLRFDYAYVPMGELGNTQILSLTLSWPGQLKNPEPSMIDVQRKLMEPE